MDDFILKGSLFIGLHLEKRGDRLNTLGVASEF
jgi:hypothetical protein